MTAPVIVNAVVNIQFSTVFSVFIKLYNIKKLEIFLWWHTFQGYCEKNCSFLTDDFRAIFFPRIEKQDEKHVIKQVTGVSSRKKWPEQAVRTTERRGAVGRSPHRIPMHRANAWYKYVNTMSTPEA